MVTWRRYAKRLIWGGPYYWVSLLLVFVVYSTWRKIFSDYALTNLFGKLENLQARGSIQLQERVRRPVIVQDDSHKVILLSYMGAGTTFVGSTFERNKDVFYVFEPEFSLMSQALNEYQPLKFIDGTVQDPVWIDDADETVERLIRNYLYCNISGIDVTSLRQGFMLEGQYTKPLYNCLQTHGDKMASCVEKVAETCKSKKFRFLKTVRLAARTIEKLLINDPSLRIIHLIRDPRGISASRVRWDEFYLVKLTFTFGRVCADMLRDIETMEKLPPEVAKRVLPVLYEEVAENPESMIKYLYDFVQMPYTDHTRRYVKNITHAANDNTERFSTQRTNSAKTAYSWRSKIRWILSKEVDTLCERVYKKVGYLAANSENVLRDYNISLRDQHINGLYLDKFRQLHIPP